MMQASGGIPAGLLAAINGGQPASGLSGPIGNGMQSGLGSGMPMGPGYAGPAQQFPQPQLTPEEALFGPNKQQSQLANMLRMKLPQGKSTFGIPAPEYRATDSGIEIERKDPYTPIDQ